MNKNDDFYDELNILSVSKNRNTRCVILKFKK